MGNYSVPEEIRKLKPKGTMVKKLNGKYYVYEHFCVKADDGKWKTKMGKMVGYINVEYGFTPVGKKIINSNTSTYQYGEYALIINNTSNVIDLLKKHFAYEDAYRIYILALINYVNDYTYIKNIDTLFKQSYLSIEHKDLKFGYSTITNLLDGLGRKDTGVYGLTKELINSSSKQLAIDGHSIKSSSVNNELSSKGNKISSFKSEQMNLLMAYDINTNKPILSKMYPGNVLDKVSIKDLINTYDFNDTLFIVDCGFYSTDNIKLFTSNNNQYIIPLSINHSNYKTITKNHEYDDEFIYSVNKKVSLIKYKETIINNKKVVSLFDVNENTLECADYLSKIDGDKYTKENYAKYKNNFGLLVLETSLINLSAKEIYELYKKRWKIETYYNFLKNDIDFNELRQSDYYIIQGLSFIFLIVGLIHHEMRTACKNIKGKTINDILLEARYLKLNTRNNIKSYSSIPAKTKELLNKLNMNL